MGTRDELERLIAMLRHHRRAPGRSTRRCRWTQAADGFAKIVAGDTAGKIVLTI